MLMSPKHAWVFRIEKHKVQKHEPQILGYLLPKAASHLSLRHPHELKHDSEQGQCDSHRNPNLQRVLCTQLSSSGARAMDGALK